MFTSVTEPLTKGSYNGATGRDIRVDTCNSPPWIQFAMLAIQWGMSGCFQCDEMGVNCLDAVDEGGTVKMPALSGSPIRGSASHFPIMVKGLKRRCGRASSSRSTRRKATWEPGWGCGSASSGSIGCPTTSGRRLKGTQQDGVTVHQLSNADRPYSSDAMFCRGLLDTSGAK